MDNRKLIIYVDDDEDDRMMMQEAFSTYDEYQLFTFERYQDLLFLIDANKPSICLIILDINMPGTSGIEILDMLKNSDSYSTIPVVMFTTGMNSPQVGHLLRNKSVGVVKKPSTLQEVSSVAEKLLEHCQNHS